MPRRGAQTVSGAVVLSEEFSGAIVVERGGSLTIRAVHEGALVVYGEATILGTHVGALQIFRGGSVRVARGGRQLGEVNSEGTFTDDNIAV